MHSPQAPPPAAARRRALVVLGMHRGGTSAVAGLLHRLGVDFGPRLMPANADNPSGYYEHNDVVNLHDRFLLRLGAAWDTVFPPEFNPATGAALAPAPGLPTYREELIALLRRDFPSPPVVGKSASPPWGIKDPRLCVLLPWWEPFWEILGSEPRFLIVLRSPDAVAASLARRDGFSPARACLLWLQHFLRAERATRGRPRCFLDYDVFLQDWRAAIHGVQPALVEEWPMPPEKLPPSETAFLDPTLRHHPGLSHPRLEIPWVEEVWRALADTAALPGADLPPETIKVLDAINAEVSRARPAVQLENNASDLSAQLAAQRRLTGWYEEEWQKAQHELNRIQRRLQRLQLKIEKQGAAKGKTPS